MAIVRWNPTRELATMHTEMDRMLESFFGAPMRRTNGNGNALMNLALDVAETDEAFVVKASIPGINAEDLEVVFDDNILSIKGEIKQEEEQEGERYHMRERRYGQFARSIKLPTTVDSDAIEATHSNGILTLNIPKAEEVKPKRIEIKS